MTNRFIKSLAVVMVLGFVAIVSTQNAYAGKGTRNFVYGALAGVAGLAAINSLSRGGYYNRGYYNRGYYDRGYYNSSYYNAGYRYRRNYYYNDYSYRRPYYRTYPRTHYRPRHQVQRHRYNGRPVAWSKAWYRYCANKYRSFRRSDGTFQPYKGGRRVCR